MKGNNKFLFEFGPPTCKYIEGAKDGALESSKATMAKGLRSGSISPSTAEVPIPPDGASSSDINITKQFRWTKSAKDSIAVQNTPTITLREYVVAVPAFFQNLAVLQDQLFGGGGKDADNIPTEGLAGQFNDLTSGITDDDLYGIPKALRTGVQRSMSFIQQSAEHVQDVADMAYKTTKFEIPDYLKSYERIYGVRKTNFIYRVPYLEDNVKNISNSWSQEGSILSPAIDLLGGIAGAAAPGVGIDFAKTFQYPKDGPSYNINFYLDNTRFDDISEWQKNYRLIYLLLYQNLPNRINRSAITPPVIYNPPYQESLVIDGVS